MMQAAQASVDAVDSSCATAAVLGFSAAGVLLSTAPDSQLLLAVKAHKRRKHDVNSIENADGNDQASKAKPQKSPRSHSSVTDMSAQG